LFVFGVTYRLTRGQGEFLISSSITWEEKGRGRVEGAEMKGVGSEWSRQTCQLHTTPGFQAYSFGKVM